MNQKAFFQLSYGLYVAAAKADSKMNGCIINNVTHGRPKTGYHCNQ